MDLPGFSELKSIPEPAAHTIESSKLRPVPAFVPGTKIFLSRKWNPSNCLEDRRLARQLVSTDRTNPIRIIDLIGCTNRRGELCDVTLDTSLMMTFQHLEGIVRF
jgi:hypothetical protein